MPFVYTDPRSTQLMKRVKIEKHAKVDELVARNLQEGKMPVIWLGRVEITANGKTYSTEVVEAWGQGDNPFSDSDIKRKFFKNASFSPLPLSQAERIVDVVMDLESIVDVSELAASFGSE